MQDETAAAFVNVLVTNSTITFLDLSINDITDEEAVDLAEAPHSNSTLKELHFLGCYITDEGVKHLSASLKRNSSLISLNLLECQVSATQEPGTWRMHFPPTPAFLSGETGAPGAESLAAGLAFNSGLTTLHMHGCIGDQVSGYLARC